MNENGIALANESYLGKYLIKKELGTGSFGITYLAVDKDSNKYAIKEYFPNEIAIRQNDNTVNPKSSNQKDIFEEVLKSFIEEAKTLQKFNHPNIVKTNGFFRANGTIYIVMDYEDGEDLQDFLEKQYTLNEDMILSIMLPLLDGLRAVHEQSYLHRDIKPANIYIRTNGIPMLIDFGASRIVLGEKSKSLSAILTDGYAPKEQYSRTSKQGVYTDLYAIGAVMYKMITGSTPVESSARSDAVTDDEPDPHPKIEHSKELSNYSNNLKKAVDWCLELRGKDRPQSVRELQDLILPTVVEDKEFKSYIDWQKNEFNGLDMELQHLNKDSEEYIKKEIEFSEINDKYGKEIEIQEYATKLLRFVAPFFFNLSMAVLGGIVSFITLYVLLFSIEINVIAANIISFFSAPVVVGGILGIINKEIDDWSYTLIALLFFISASFLN